ncbi:bifunctional chorismate mutase/prephenate dehydratase [Helicobacter sp. MIT 14-3879]|uniref:bifunctional chorismate mutase/prephenate dehydratase n=1 Tax=Helicobacter sp. MIT 14-3879 TaxID=2040649 RepID=UPI000E1F941E|nr:bifunctional chorismate mutase/prephenate dehydratase [Helicobacter sp. MIT 14-3879]RDU61598.1 chloride transporter [Helicobacter sp. MIT 14-3879]
MQKKQAKCNKFKQNTLNDSNKLIESNSNTGLNESQINALRKEIDIIDSQLITLLHERLKFVKQIGHLKVQSNANIYRPDREKSIIAKLLQYAKQHNLHHLNKASIEAIFYEIFAIARDIEMPQKIAFLGPVGSFCHQAAETRFGPLSSYLPLSTISAVFESLQEGNAKYGVIPLENNTNGMVGESIDNLAKYPFTIINEIILTVHHSFATQANDLKDIDKIYSKDIAFGQCRDFLNHYDLQDIEQISVSSTAHAARLASLDSKSAAICSNIAATLYKLPIMFHRIQTSLSNQTRFVIISDFFNPRGSNDKTSIFVSIKDYEKAGALFELLRDFKEEDINITKIDSRPIHDDRGFRSGFYMDFHGHREDVNVKRIFAKREGEIKWLGSYPMFS